MKLRLPLGLLMAVMAACVPAFATEYTPGSDNITLSDSDTLYANEDKLEQSGTITLDIRGQVGGSVAPSNAGNAFKITGSILGTGDFVKMGKNWTAVTDLTKATFTGDTIIKEGILQLGNKLNAEGGTYSFGTGRIIVESGAKLFLFPISGEGKYTFTNDIFLKNGGLMNINENSVGLSGNGIFTGNFQFGEIDTDSVTLFAAWGMGMTLEGIVSGKGTVKVTNEFNWMNLTLKNDNNTFSGTYEVRNGKLTLASQNAAAKAKVNLIHPTGEWARLIVNTDVAVIAGLSGVDNTNITVVGESSMRELIVRGGGSYGGTLGEYLSLTKEGSDTLILRSDSVKYTGKTTVREGVLQVGTGGEKGSLGSGEIHLAGGTLSFNRSDNYLLSNLLTGTSGTVEVQSGSLVIKNTKNTFSGDFSLKGGNLQFDFSGNKFDFAGNITGTSGKVLLTSGTLSLSGSCSVGIDVSGQSLLLVGENASLSSLVTLNNGHISFAGTGERSLAGLSLTSQSSSSMIIEGGILNLGTVSGGGALVIKALGDFTLTSTNQDIAAFSQVTLFDGYGVKTVSGINKGTLIYSDKVMGAFDGSNDSQKSGELSFTPTGDATMSVLSKTVETLYINSGDLTGKALSLIQSGSALTVTDTLYFAGRKDYGVKGGALSVNNLSVIMGNLIVDSALTVNGKITLDKGSILTLTNPADFHLNGSLTGGGVLVVDSDGICSFDFTLDSASLIQIANRKDETTTLKGGSKGLSGSGIVEMKGDGVLALGDKSFASDFSGKLVVNKGTVNVTTANALGLGSAIVNDGTLQLSIAGGMGSGSVTLDGGRFSFVSGALAGLTGINVMSTGTILWQGANTDNDIFGKLSIHTAATVVFDTGANNIIVPTSTKLKAATFIKEGTGDLFLNLKEGTAYKMEQLVGDVIVNAGTLTLDGNDDGGGGVIAGTITVNENGKLITKSAALGGRKNPRVTAITLNKSEWNMAASLGVLSGARLTLNNGARITGTDLYLGNWQELCAPTDIITTGAGNVMEMNMLNFRQDDTVFDIGVSDPGTVGLTIKSVIKYAGPGNGNLIKKGAGTLVLANNNDYEGKTIIQTGTLQLGDGGTTGTTGKGAISLGEQGTLAYKKEGTVDLTLSLSQIDGKYGKLSFLNGSTASIYNLSGASLGFDSRIYVGTGAELVVKESGVLGSGVSFTVDGGKLNISGITVPSPSSGASFGLTMKGASQLSFGANNIFLQMGSADFSQLKFYGTNTGALTLVNSGADSLTLGENLVGVSGYYYAGAGGINYTSGKNIGSVKGIYGGSNTSQVAASGNIVIGSKTAGITTILDFGTADSNTNGIYGAGKHLGDTTVTGVNATVLASLTIQGTLIGNGAITEAGKSSTTKITGRIYGGGNTGANVYGSTSLSLSGIHFVGGNPTYPEGGQAIIMGGGHHGTTVFGNVGFTISDSIIDSKLFGGGGNVKGNIQMATSGSLFTQNVYVGVYSGGTIVDGSLTLADVGSTFKSSIYASRDGIILGDVSLSLSGSSVMSSVYGGNEFSGQTYEGNVALNLLNNTIVEGSVYGSGANGLKGKVTLNVTNSTVNGSIYGGGTGGTIEGVVNVTLSGATIKGNVFGLNNGVLNEKITLSLTNTSVSGNVLAGASSAGEHLKKGAELTLNNVTAKLVGIAGVKNEIVNGDTVINIEGNSQIVNFIGTGGAVSAEFTNTLEYASITGDLTANISGGTIGAGLTGTESNMFSMVGRNSTLTGNAYLNISGGTIKNEFISLVGAAGALTGNSEVSLSQGGVIESNIRATATGKINGNLIFNLDGGVLGLDGNTRSLEAGSVIAGNGKVLGNVTINLDGTNSMGVGTVFKGDYSILAGATLGDAVGGNTAVKLSNISTTGGVADFTGLISGANATGGGVTGAERTLTFESYTTSTAAQYKHFTLATVKGNSSVVFAAGAISSDIANWDIQDTSTLTISKTGHLTAPSTVKLAEEASLVVNAGEEIDLGGIALSGSGTLTKNGTEKLSMSGDGDAFSGKVEINSGILVLNGTGNSFGENAMISLQGGVLKTEKTAHFELKSLLSGSGDFIVQNETGIKTILSNTGLSSSSFTGELKVKKGVLQLGKGVRLSGNKASIDAGAILNVESDLQNSLGNVVGLGTLGVNANSSLTGGAQLSDFLGTVSIGNGINLQVSVGASTPLLNSGATIAFTESSTLTLNNTTGVEQNFTLGDLKLSNAGNLVKFTGEATHLVVTQGDNWAVSDLEADVGQLIFDMDTSANSSVVISQLSNNNKVFVNIFMTEGGVTYQTQTDSNGRLVKITLDQMTELPVGGVPDMDVVSYRITEENTGLSGAVLTMTGDSNISSLNIVSAEGHRGWNLNGHSVLIAGGSLMFQGKADYLISGGASGRLSASSGILGISQMSASSTLTVSAEIVDGDRTTAVKKLGVGKVIMDGKLSNTGGLQVVTGELQLKGKATGTAGGGVLNNYAVLTLGDGANEYRLGYKNVRNNTEGKLHVSSRAVLGGSVMNEGTLNMAQGSLFAEDIVFTNNGNVNFEIGKGNTFEMPESVSGTGVWNVKSGTLSVGGGIRQNFDITADAQMTWNLKQAVASGMTMTGEGKILVNNDSRQDLDLSGVILGTQWTGFRGTLELKSGTGSLRTKFNTAMGEALVIVNKGTQYWDASATASRSMAMDLNGTGYEGTGALRVSKSGIYTGGITIGNDGARISSDGVNVTLQGNIAGGILEIGSTDTSLSSNFILSGDNTQSWTRLMGKSHVVVTSLHGLGLGLDLSSADSSAELQGSIETGKVTGVAGSHLSLVEGSSLTVTGATHSVFAGSLSGTGNLIKLGLGEWTLSGENSQSGQVKIEDGKLIVGHDRALGNVGNQVFVGASGKLDLSSYAVAQGITLRGGVELSGAANYTGALSVLAGPGTSQILGNLNAGSLHLRDSAARVQINGDMLITGGGSLCLDASNANTNTALVTVNGKMTLRGEYLINLDTNSYYGDKSVKFKLFEAEKYPRATGDYTFALAMDPIYEEFFQLKDNYKQEMVQSGSLTVTINVKAVVGALVNQADVDAMGANGYVSRGESFYLGAESNEGNALYFDKKYTIAAGDNAYRLTNGDGWLQFASQMTGDNKLIISKFVQGSNPDSGIVIANNNNNYTGGTSVLNVHLTVDGSVNKGQVMPESGLLGALGSGAVNMLGQAAILELRPNGANGGQYWMNNAINLYDGAQLIHSGGSELTLTGAINSGGSAVGVIANNSEQKLILQGKLIAEQLVFKGMTQISRSAGESGAIVIAGGGTLGSLTLSDQSQVDIQSGTQVNSLLMDKGTILNVGGGSELSYGSLTRGSEGSGDTLMNLLGGQLTILSDTQFGGNEQIKLSLAQDGANTLNVGNQADVIVSDLKARDGGLNKIGEGMLELTGNLTEYVGNLYVGSGLLRINTSQLRSELNVSGHTAKLEVVDNTTLSGKLQISEGGKATLGNAVTLSSDLVMGSGSQLSTGQNNWITGEHLSFENGAKAVFGEGTQLGQAEGNTRISMGNNVSLEFGLGSKLNGQMEGGLHFRQGDRFKGELNVGANAVNFGAGSVFEIDGSHYEKYTNGACLLTGTGTINLEKGMKFELSGFNENMRPLPQSMGLITTTEGSLLIDGKEVEHGRFYSEYLSEHPYVWLSFDLLGVNNSLSLYIQKDVRFDLFAQTHNEMAISGVASEIALHADNYGGELNKLGTVLSAATYDNVHDLLGGLSQSTSSILSGYSVQMQNLRRHTLEIMNRAIQTKPENSRLSYEETNNSFWANGISGTYKMDGDANVLGNTTSVWGGSLGMSTTVSETTVVGLAFTYTTSDVQVDRGVGKTTVDAYNIDLFARYHKDNWNITGVVTGGFTSHDIMRNLNLDGYQSQTKSSADGNQVMAMVQAGYEFIVSDDQNSILEPFVLVTGGYSSLDSLSETGAGTAGLNVESDSTALCSLGAGVRFVREYMVEATSFERGRFEARMMVIQDVTDMNPTVSASFQGAPNSRFEQEGVAPGKTALLLGVGVVHPLSQSTAVFADVDGEFRDGGTGVGANVGIKYMF